jgi:hypothetical protein
MKGHVLFMTHPYDKEYVAFWKGFYQIGSFHFVSRKAPNPQIKG